MIMVSRGLRWGVLVVAMGSVSCASYFTRKECEKTNWYQHGFKVAMEGQRVDADNFVKECTRVNAEINHGDLDTGFKAGMAKYCEPETVFQSGKSGKPLSADMCDDHRLPKLKLRHAEGIKIFCQPHNAHRFGASGGKYENVCPEAMEEAFLVEYRKGRKIYLNHMIEEKEKEMREIDRKIANLENKRKEKNRDLLILPAGRVLEREKKYDPKSRSVREEVKVKEDEETRHRRSLIEDEINQLSYDIRNAERDREGIRVEIRKLREEAIAL